MQKGGAGMEWDWLCGLIYGLLGGFSEFLPVSPDAHNAVFLRVSGLEAPGYGISFAVHFGALAAVILYYYKHIAKILYERKIFTQPKRIRKRQPDFVSVMQWRLLTTASIPVVLSCLAAPWLRQHFNRLWMLVLIIVVNGIIVFLPHYMSRANKDARTLSPLDATLIGLSGVLGAVPGISRVGTLNAVGSMRGADSQFGLDFTYLLSIPALITLCIGDLFMLMSTENSQAGAMVLPGVFACIAAFGAAIAGIKLMRFLAVKSNYESLAYYNWGLAIFTFIIYLIG